MFTVSRVDTWVAEVEDRAGGLRDVLGSLAKIGVDLEFLIARRDHANPKRGLVFVSPISAAHSEAAQKLGFRWSQSLHTLRIVGYNQPGSAFLITQAIASLEISLRGVSAATLGEQFIMHLAFDSEEESERAQQRLKTV